MNISDKLLEQHNRRIKFGYEGLLPQWALNMITKDDKIEGKTLPIDHVIETFEVGDKIIVCDDLITEVTKIKDNVIYFFDEKNVERWDTKDVIKHHSR